MNLNKKAFSLIEIMVWIIIVSVVIVSWFEAFTRLSLWKIWLMENTNIQKDSFYFSEKLFQLIKEGWTIDYEEYFNRKVIWNTQFSKWHYLTPSWFWNFWKDSIITTDTYWNNFYYCMSKNWVKIWDFWCISDFNTSNILTTPIPFRNIDYSLSQQRYGQYSYQFIDYNSNYDDDFWDENWNGVVTWDDDDEFLWTWPFSFNSWEDVKELYLISWDKKTRTFIRWSVDRDSDAPTSKLCDENWKVQLEWNNYDWCRGTIEFLKLEGVDWWMDHNINTPDWTQNDWVIDTWLIDRQFTWLSNSDNANSIIAWSNTTSYWRPLFPTSINVTDFKIFPYPNVDSKYFWKDSTASSNISPYVILNFKIKPSWEVRKVLKKDPRSLNFNLSVNLTDIFSK